MGRGENAPTRVLEKARAELAQSALWLAIDDGALPRNVAVSWLRAEHALTWRLHRATLGLRAPAFRTVRDRHRARMTSLASQLQPYDEATALSFPAAPLAELLLAFETASPSVVEAMALGLELMGEHPLQLDGELVRWGRPRKRREAEPSLDADGTATLEHTVRQVIALATSLYPVGTLPTTSSSLNRDAGRHHITQDPRELAAALVAGARTWEIHPYYEARYGERGRRFTRSDSAWLASLGQDPTAEQQIEWLAGVLAARGMPTLLLESHLNHLHEALIDILPHRRSTYAWLLERAHGLYLRRTEALSDRSLGRLAARFTPSSPPFRGMGTILAAAVADHATGIPRALESVLVWAKDEERFGTAWVQAVDELVDAAQRSVQRRRSAERRA